MPQAHDEPAALHLKSFLDFGPVLEAVPQLSILRHPYLIHRAIPQHLIEFGDQLLLVQRIQIALYPTTLSDERLSCSLIL